MVISMKTINCSDWSLHNKLKASMFMPESSIGIDNLIREFYDCNSIDNLIRKFYDCNSFELGLFYYRLEVCNLY